MIRLSPQGKWEDEQIVSCGKILRWRADVLEHRCPKCKRYSLRWADVYESNYCSHCGEKMTKEDSDDVI